MADLEARAKRVLSPVLGHYTWLPIERGEGSWLITDTGRRILDLTCGIAVTPVGHAHPRVVAALTAQAQRLSHICAGVALYAYLSGTSFSAPEVRDLDQAKVLKKDKPWDKRLVAFNCSALYQVSPSGSQ